MDNAHLSTPPLLWDTEARWTAGRVGTWESLGSWTPGAQVQREEMWDLGKAVIWEMGMATSLHREADLRKERINRSWCFSSLDVAGRLISSDL